MSRAQECVCRLTAWAQLPLHKEPTTKGLTVSRWAASSSFPHLNLRYQQRNIGGRLDFLLSVVLGCGHLWPFHCFFQQLTSGPGHESLAAARQGGLHQPTQKMPTGWAPLWWSQQRRQRWSFPEWPRSCRAHWECQRQWLCEGRRVQSK